jgi:hypothetical protein
MYDHNQQHTQHSMEAMPELALPTESPQSTSRRPHLEARGYTERGGGDNSPSLLAADQSDPVDRVSLINSSPPSLYTNLDSSFSFDRTVASEVSRFYSSLPS